MSDQNKAIARRWFDEVINGRKPEVVDEIFSPDYVHHANFTGDLRRNEVKQAAAAILAAYPDRKATVYDVIAEGDRVAVRWSSTGTLRAAFLGRQPTGKQETATGFWLARFQDGRAVEGWEVIDFGATEA